MTISEFLFANKRRKRLVLLVILIILIWIMSFFIRTWADQPATSVISLSKNTTASIKYQTINTPYFKTLLPQDYRIQNTTNTSIQSRYTLTALGTDNDVLIAFVSDYIPVNGLKSDPDYLLRISEPSVYKPFSEANMPPNSIAFESSLDNNEYTIYMTNGNRYVATTVSDGLPYNLLDLLNIILKNWQWKI